MLSGGSFEGDLECGALFSGEPLKYDLIADQSVGSFNSIGAAESFEEGHCSRTDDALVIGKAAFRWKSPNGDTNDDKYFNINLNGLSIQGGFASTAAAGGECPKEAPLCQGVECGEDFFGAECGGCEEEGFSCAAGACVQGGCIPDSKDKTLGFPIGDATWNTTAAGEPWSLHSECGTASAVWFIRTATW